MADDEMLLTEEVAEQLRCTPRYVRALIARGELKAVRIGGTGKQVKYRVPASAVQAWISDHQTVAS